LGIITGDISFHKATYRNGEQEKSIRYPKLHEEKEEINVREGFYYHAFK
jgi:hypothetical protein